MKDLKNYFLQQVATNQMSVETAKVYLNEIKAIGEKICDLAIVGMACRVPGANTAAELWDLMELQKCTIGSFPEGRRADTDPFLPDDATYQTGGYLDQVDQFDAAFFKISNREAEVMDPTQRLFLETVWHAIEDSGLGPKRISGSKTGVFVGWETNTALQYARIVQDQDEFAVIGSHTSILASRISYLLDLKGPSIVIDTACSSSLVALDTACKNLRNKEIDIAVVGGVSTLLFPAGGVMMYDSGDGDVKAFDADANGTVFSEGIGAVVIMPLSTAQRLSLPVYSVIKGSAVNNDGASNGLTAPNAEAQADVITQAWKNANIHPETVSYIEAHGTGTKIGDPIEVKGIARAFAPYTSKKQICGVGTLKTNIGHTGGASGIISVIKMSLALQNKKLPGMGYFQNPNPLIPFAESPVYIQKDAEEWRSEETPLRCGISAFGFNGTNCHVVLEEAAPDLPEGISEEADQVRLFVVSARTEYSLRQYVKQYIKALENPAFGGLGDLCYSASTTRGHYACRLAIVVSTKEELLEKLRQVENHTNDLTPAKKSSGKQTEENKIRQTEEAKRRLARIGNRPTFEDLAELAVYYIDGVDFDWERLYAGENHRVLRLPVYPYERQRYWAGQQQSVQPVPERVRPIEKLCKCIVQTETETVFQTDLATANSWLLDEHLLFSVPTLPGTAYVELAIEAAKQSHIPMSGLERISFLNPYHSIQKDPPVLYTIIRKLDGHRYAFEIGSNMETAEDGYTWMVHAIGTIVTSEEMTYSSESLVPNDENPEIMHVTQELVEGATGDILFGPRFSNVRTIERYESVAVLHLRIDDPYMDECSLYNLHPALLDRAAGLGANLFLNNQSFVPFAVGEIKVLGPIPSSCTSIIRFTSQAKDWAKFDVWIKDDAGRLVVYLKDFCLKRYRHGTRGNLQDSCLLQPEWKLVQEEPTDRTEMLLGAVAVIKATRGKKAGRLADLLRAEGTSVLEVEIAESFAQTDADSFTVGTRQEDYERLADELKARGVMHVFHLAGWDVQASIERLEALQWAQTQGVDSLFYLTKALVQKKLPGLLELVLAGSSAYTVTGTEERLHPENAALYGLGRVVGQEYGNIRCRAIDVDENMTAERLLAELRAETPAYVTAIRGEERYVESVGEAEGLERREDATIREQGVYLITGGTGGLGLEIGQYLASQARINLVLLNRSKFPLRSEWNVIMEHGENAELCGKIAALQAIERTGSRVHCYRTDVGSEEQLKTALEDIRSKYGAIRGIVHSAGVAGDGFLLKKEKRVFDEVMDPKMRGTWLLDRLTEQDKPDFMVLFSSITALGGAKGQGDYTAANAYLDAYTDYRNRQGKRTLSINWATWKETGMAVKFGVNHDQVFRALSTSTAISAFDQVLHGDTRRIIIGELDATEVAKLGTLPIRMSEAIMERMERRKSRVRNEAIEPVSTAVMQAEIKLRGKNEGNYTGTEKQLAKIWAEVFRLNEVDITDNFYDLGGDSILAVKLANRVNELKIRHIDIVDIFECLTIAELAKYMDLEKSTEGTEKLRSEVADDVSSEFKLSSAQRRIWFLQKMHSTTSVYHIQSVHHASSAEELDKYIQALNIIVSRHDMLRACFTETEGEPKQYVLQQYDLPVKYEDLHAQGCVNELSEHLTEEKNRRFENGTPMIRVSAYHLGEGKHCLSLVLHHLITDGWSSELFFREITEVYQILESGTGVPVNPPTKTYRDWIHEQQQWIHGEEGKKAESYWLSELSGPLPTLQLPTDNKRPAVQRFDGDYQILQLNAELTDRLKALSRQHSCTMHVTMLSIFFLLLHKFSEDEDIIVGFPVAGRDHAGVEDILGLFMNLVSVRVRFGELRSLADIIGAVKRKSSEALKYGRYPFDQLVSKVNPLRDVGRSPIFTALFQYYDHSQENDDSVLHDISFLCKEVENGLRIRIEYSASLFKRETIETYLSVLEQLIARVCTEADQPLHQILEDESSGLGTSILLPPLFENDDRDVVRAFREQCRRTPDAVAVRAGDARLTYRELDARSNQIAWLLSREGVGTDCRVGIMTGRTEYLPIALLGILKSGAAYVPYDPSYPVERIQYMAEHSGTEWLLTESNVLQETEGAIKSASQFKKIVQLDSVSLTKQNGIKLYGPVDILSQPSSELPIASLSQAPMYIMFTSGSTGKPKGVVVSHANVMNFLEWAIQDCRLDARDRMLLVTSISFDISVFEIFSSLISGACLHIIPGDLLLDHHALLGYIAEHEITVWHSVPTLMKQLLLAMHSRNRTVKTIRRIMIGGEAWYASLAMKMSNAFPGATIVNMYGPTETTIWVASHVVDTETLDEHSIIPIGTAISNNELLVLNEKLRACRPGVPGEIYIVGSNVTLGYWNDPERTSEVFIQDDRSGRVLYKTGDLGRRLSDGKVEFIGRKDGMVKIRGYRVEMSEVESAALACDGVTEAAIITVGDENAYRLVGFFVSNNANSISSVRAQLAEKLPHYMVPSQLIQIEEMPLTLNGKIDRKSLAANLANYNLKESKDEMPTTDVEKQLCDLWGEVLGLPYVGMNDSFFDLGGDSYKMAELHALIEQRYPERIRIVDIFSHPTVYLLAKLIRDQDPLFREEPEAKESSDDLFDRLFEDIQNGEMSIDEAAMRLQNWRERND